jgi:aspartokinase
MRVAGIVARARTECPLVVVSAMGKTTDGLAAALDAAVAGDEAAALSGLAAIRERTQVCAGRLPGADAAPVLADLAPLFTGLERMARASCTR